MGQVLHGSATTTEAVRRAIQHSQESLSGLAKRYGVNPKTVAKWKARSFVSDLPTGPKQPRSTVLSAEEEAVVVAFRRHTLLPLDDCLYALQPAIPHLTRSSLHRCLRRHGISRLPQVEGEASAKRKFKAYPIGYFHIDSAEVRTAQGKLYLLTSPLLSPEAPEDLFDLLIFDEAHHAPADTWKAYLDRFSKSRFVFLTATPFRRDKRAIPGRTAYSYPVSRASREKAFGKVHFRAAAVVNGLDEDEVDGAVARVAVRQLTEDRARGFDHRLFARAASINSAERLVGIYAIEGIKVAAIASHISKKVQDETESALISGELDGVVCVDMFGEGYDFPKLMLFGVETTTSWARSNSHSSSAAGLPFCPFTAGSGVDEEATLSLRSVEIVLKCEAVWRRSASEGSTTSRRFASSTNGKAIITAVFP